ncbi:hypothetical protein BS50DRAFT_593429 [Corynespora cassiicola Philippines]|uniref:Zn(2)-C6 fungal-type domain-containing protein n=1 Tax=Corynespora cassiicola Philippines TaxID=1448308 RepID=A0A2T2N6M9_CORCC|nr:hypothetical protein BS50DRAFT_593429 [Corynespora cassiicola Philippines]
MKCPEKSCRRSKEGFQSYTDLEKHVRGHPSIVSRRCKKACDTCKRTKSACIKRDRGACKRCNIGGFSCTYNGTPVEVPADCIDKLFTIHPLNIFLDREHIRNILEQTSVSGEAYALGLSVTAYLKHEDTSLLENATHQHSVGASSGEPSLEALLSSYFLGECYEKRGDNNKSWWYLHQATAQAQLLQLQHEKGKGANIYWLLFVKERINGIRKHRPITLFHLPQSFNASFSLRMLRMYGHIDHIFMSMWNHAESQSGVLYLLQLQVILCDALPSDFRCKSLQDVDLHVNKCWLQSMTWKLCRNRNFISATTKDLAMRIGYPVQICEELIPTIQFISEKNKDTEISDLIAKLLDIYQCLIDTLSMIDG